MCSMCGVCACAVVSERCVRCVCWRVCLCMVSGECGVVWCGMCRVSVVCVCAWRMCAVRGACVCAWRVCLCVACARCAWHVCAVRGTCALCVARVRCAWRRADRRRPAHWGSQASEAGGGRCSSRDTREADRGPRCFPQMRLLGGDSSDPGVDRGPCPASAPQRRPSRLCGSGRVPGNRPGARPGPPLTPTCELTLRVAQHVERPASSQTGARPSEPRSSPTHGSPQNCPRARGTPSRVKCEDEKATEENKAQP